MPTEVVQYDGQDYDFLSFVYQGATRTRNGDNLEAGLVLSCNRISRAWTRVRFWRAMPSQ